MLCVYLSHSFVLRRAYSYFFFICSLVKNISSSACVVFSWSFVVLLPLVFWEKRSTIFHPEDNQLAYVYPWISFPPHLYVFFIYSYSNQTLNGLTYWGLVCAETSLHTSRWKLTWWENAVPWYLPSFQHNLMKIIQCPWAKVVWEFVYILYNFCIQKPLNSRYWEMGNGAKGFC